VIEIALPPFSPTKPMAKDLGLKAKYEPTVLPSPVAKATWRSVTNN
jgi:hypothetical protein